MTNVLTNVVGSPVTELLGGAETVLPASSTLPSLLTLPALSPLESLPGTVLTQFIRCGKPGCRCLAGEKHGPYYYRMWREGSKVKKAYIPQANLPQVLMQCALHQSQQDRLLRLRTEREAVWRSILCQAALLHALVRQRQQWDAETTVG